MNTENIKTNKTHKFVLSLSQRLDLKNSDKFCQKLFITHGKISNSSTKIINLNNSANVK